MYTKTEDFSQDALIKPKSPDITDETQVILSAGKIIVDGLKKRNDGQMIFKLTKNQKKYKINI